MNSFDVAGTPGLVFKPEPLNAVENLEVVLGETSKGELLQAYFWQQSDIPSPWNTYWTDTASESGSLDINVGVFGQYWTKYRALHWGLLTDCDPKEPYDCDGHNCPAALSTVEHTAAAATTAKSLGIPQIDVIHPTPTPSEIDVYNWHW